MPPRTRVPGLVTTRQFVAQADDAAVILLQVRAYSQGCLLEFLTVTRAPSDTDDPPRFDIDFGTRLDERPVMHRLDDPASGAPRLWISPLPPVEGFRLVTNWPRHGIVDSTATVEGGAIRQAAWESFPCLPAATE